MLERDGGFGFVGVGVMFFGMRMMKSDGNDGNDGNDGHETFIRVHKTNLDTPIGRRGFCERTDGFSMISLLEMWKRSSFRVY